MPFAIVIAMQKMGQVLCGLVLVWAAWATLNNLWVGPLEVYDEGTYAKITQESLARRDFLTFTLYDNLWFEKPPLYFWLAGVATAATGSEVLGIRLPAALFAIALVVLTMFVAYRASLNSYVAALAGVLLVLTPPFIAGAREARLDILAAFFIMLALWAALDKKYVWFGTAVALAVLSKSIIAVFAAAALPLVSLWSGDWGWIQNRRFWLGVGVSLCILAPWHIYEWALWGTEFWRQYVVHHVLMRYETNLFLSPDLQTNYLARLSEQTKLTLSAFFVSILTVPLYIRGLGTKERVLPLAALCLVLFMVGVFFTAQTRALSYLLPIYPVVALFVSLSLWHMHRVVYKSGE